MRLAFTSLALAAGLATAAQAQDPAAQPAPAPAPSTAQTAPATDAVPPAAPAEAAPAAPGATPPAAETPPAPPAEPAAPPPTLPTSGYGYEVIRVVEEICIPAVRGQKIADVAKARGFKQNRRDGTWARSLGEGRHNQVILFPTGVNSNVCTAELRYPMGTDEEVAKALNVWAFLHEPPLEPTANYTQPVDPDGLKRVRRSWEHLTSNQSIGLNFSTVRKPDDTQVNKNYDQGTLQYQERTF